MNKKIVNLFLLTCAHFLNASENLLLQLQGGTRPLITCGFFGNDAIAMPADDHSLTLYNFDGSLKKKIFGATRPISAYDQSSTGKYCATGSYDTTMLQYDGETGDPHYSFHNHNDTVSLVRFSYDERVRASLAWDNSILGGPTTNYGAINYFLKPHNSVITISPDAGGENLAVSFFENKHVELWKIGKYNAYEVSTVLVGHEQDVYALDWNPHNATVATGSTDGTIKLWDSATGQIIKSFAMGGKCAPLRFSHNGNFLAVGNAFDSRIHIFDMRTFAVVAALAGHLGGTDDIKWAPDDTKIVSCSDREKKVKVWSSSR